jgi:hypothetical protein
MNNNTHDLFITNPSLEQVRQRFESWRQRRKKRTRIPGNLWQAAVALSEEYSICHLSKVLRVNYTTLKEKVIDANTPDKHTRDVFSSPFIELPHPATSLPESTIEMIKTDGSVMRAHVKGAACSDLVALGKAFLAAEP